MRVVSIARRLGMSVAAILVGLTMSLTSCAPLSAPPGPAITEPQLQVATFVAADGTALPVREWLPTNGRRPRAVVVAIHGFNDYSRAFDTAPGAPGVGPYLAAQGFALFAYDQRGFGGSPHWGFWSGGPTMAADFTAFSRLVHARYPDVPLYGLGESMGGAVVLTALAGSDPPPLAGAILVAPAVWGRSTMPWLYRFALWAADHVAPGWKPTGRNLGHQPSDNIEMLLENGRDPLFIKQTRIDAVAGLVNLMDGALRASGQQKLPMLYLTGAHDQIIPPKAAAQAMGRLLATDPLAKGAFYDQSWHMMLRDHAAATPLADIAAFLAAPSASLPSGADRDALARLQARAHKPWVEKAPHP